MRRIPLVLLILVVLTACSAPAPAASPAVPAPAEETAQEAPPLPSPTAAPSATPPPAPTATAAPTQTSEPTATAGAPATPEPEGAPAAGETLPAPGTDLVNAAWQGSGNPGCNLLIFQPDGQLTVQSDCQTASGTWTRSADSLQLTFPPDLPGSFAANLRQVNGWALSEGRLKLNGAATPQELTPATLLPNPPAAEGTEATLLRGAPVFLGPEDSFPLLGYLPVGSKVTVLWRIDGRPFWGVSMPGWPDGVGWVPRDAVEVAPTAEVPWTQADKFQTGGKELLWPEVRDPRAGVRQETTAYAGPGPEYVTVLMLVPGDTFYVLGRSADDQFVQIYTPGGLVPGDLAWVAADTVELKNIEAVPVAVAPPAPGRTRMAQPAAGEAVVVPLTTVNIRGGPGVEYTVLRTAERGETLAATGLTPDGVWYRIRVPAAVSADGIAWISAPNVRTLGGGTVPTVEYPFPMPLLRPDTLGPLCQVVSQTPREMSILPMGLTIDFRIELRNTSNETWSRGDIDFVYIDSIDNAPMHLGPDRIDLAEHVAAGDVAVVEFQAKTPTKHPLVYGERWVVRKAGETVCAFTYQYRVK